MTPYIVIKYIILAFLCNLCFIIEDKTVVFGTLFAIGIETILIFMEFKMYENVCDEVYAVLDDLKV